MLLQTRLPAIGQTALVELGVVACVAAALGLVAVWIHRPRSAALLAFSAIGIALLLSMLGKVATAGILLPALVACWILAGAGFGLAWNALASRDARTVSRAAALACVALLSASVPVAQGWRNFDENNHHDDTNDDDYVVALFQGLPARAAFVDEDDYRFLHTLDTSVMSPGPAMCWCRWPGIPTSSGD